MLMEWCAEAFCEARTIRGDVAAFCPIIGWQIIAEAVEKSA